MKQIAHSLEETQKMAEDFVRNFVLTQQKNMATVVGLYGDLGAGKTSFTQGLAKALNIKETVISPTFIIEKIYEIQNEKFSCLIHIDAYRLDKAEELEHLGWQEIISDPQNLILIEWPERIKSIMPDHIKVNFSHLSPDEREIEIVL